MCTHLWLSCHPQHMAHTTEHKYSTTQQHSRMINKNYDPSSQYKLRKWQSIASTCKNLNCKCTLIPAPNKRIKQNRFHLSLAALLNSSPSNKLSLQLAKSISLAKIRGKKHNDLTKKKHDLMLLYNYLTEPTKQNARKSDLRTWNLSFIFDQMKQDGSPLQQSTVLQQFYPLCVFTCTI